MYILKSRIQREIARKLRRRRTETLMIDCPAHNRGDIWSVARTTLREPPSCFHDHVSR
jgi:hypothetical protein